MKSFIFSVIVLTILFIGIIFFPNATAQVERQSLGGVDVDGSWYLGEGLKQGDYFEYSLCELDLNDCAPVTMKIWIKGDTQKGSETLWDTSVVVFDGNKISKGTMGLGKIAPESVEQSENLFKYSRAYKSSIAWLSAFSTADEKDLIHGPKEFRANAWGKIGAIGGTQLIPIRAETITVPAGTFNTIVVGWYSGNNNEIWIVDDFPFPVRALAYAWVTTGTAPVMFQFELLKYEKNVQSDPFKDIVSTPEDTKKLGCPKDFFGYTSGSKSTNTFSMQIEYSYSPKNPKTGCDIDWKINFKNKFNENAFVDQVHFDIWVVDEKGNKLRSYASEQGRQDIFNGFGQAHILLPVKEPAGKSHYAIFVYGISPQSQAPSGKYAGYILVDIDIAANENLPIPNSDNKPVPSQIQIPTWIKTNGGWWASGQIDDSSFVQGIQWLIKNGIMKIPATQQGTGTGSNEIPTWIKTNAGWWASGQISDSDFVQGIQWLIANGIMKIA